MYDLLLALSLNIDSFSIGVNYGVKKIKIPVFSLLTIVSMSIGALLISYLIGHFIFSLIPVFFAKTISSILLILWGFFLFSQTLININYPPKKEEVTIKKIKIKSFNIVINIVRESERGDLDNSGVIDFREALYIGIALAIDALTVGFSLAAHQIDLLWFLSIAAAFNFTFLIFGQLIGKFVGTFVSENKLKLIACVMIILLGLSKFF